MIAALYVQTNGVYYGLPDVDPWDETRDARLYDGQDDGCFESALAAVRRFGGVIEHPRHTLAWRTFGLPMPTRDGRSSSLWDSGYATEVDQGMYGHPVHKPTWLYFVGGPPPAMRWGTSDRPKYVAKRLGGGPANSTRGAIRSATPPAFRDALLEMARSALPSFDILPA